MPFKEIDVKKEIEKNIKTNKGFKFEYQKANLEYELIQKIIKARKEKGLLQKDMKELTGLTQQMISNIETYNRMPTLKTILKYIHGLGYELELKKINE